MEVLVKKYISNSTDSTIQDIAQEINSQKASVVTLVQLLEPLLTNTDPFERARGVGLLAKVLKLTDSTSQQTATVLIEFFLSRLDDQPSVAEIVNGILTLMEMNVVSKTEQLNIPSRIFIELNVQNFPQSVRFTIFSIFEKLFEQNVGGVTKLGSEFIMGFIHSMDGEKDPRNLFILFKLAKLILENLDYKSHLQDLFEVCFCYFPITFRPPPDDPYGITADDLKGALRDIICFSPEFAPQAIPVLLEKLGSSTPSAKKDAIETISACLPVYGINAFTKSLKEIWDLLKAELAAASESELVALHCLREITKASALSIVSSKDTMSPLEKTLGIIVPDCLRNLQEPELKYARPCGKILLACASSNSTACTMIVNQVWSPIVKQYNAEESPSKKKVLLGVLVDLMMASRLVTSTKIVKDTSDMEIDMISPLTAYKDECLEILTSVLVETAYTPLRAQVVKGMYEVLAITGLLNESEVALVMEHLSTIVIKNETEEVTKEALDVLEKLSAEQPVKIQQYILKALVHTLERAGSVIELKGVLDGFKALCVEESLFSYIVPRLMKQLHVFAREAAPYDFGTVLLQYVADILLRSSAWVAPQVEILHKWIHDKAMFDYTLQETHLMHLMGKLLSIITRALDSQGQSLLLRALMDKNGSQDGIPTTEKFAFLYQAVMTNLRPTTPTGIQSAPVFLNGLVKLALESKHSLYLEAAGTIFGSMINKDTNEEHINTLFKTWEQMYLVSAINAHELDLVTREFVVIIAGWVAKGLLYKSHPLGQVLAGQLLDLLEHPQLAHAATIGIEIIIKENDLGILTKQSFVLQKILFKQKFYHFCYPILVEKFEKLEGEVKKYPLMALSHLLCNLSNKSIVNEYSKLFPMLLFSLRYPDSKLKKSTLDTFEIIIHDKPELFAENISTMIPQLLKLSKHEPGNDVHVRQAALKILGLFAKSIEYSILAPHKSHVLKSLGHVLEDHKRVVRKEAANTRAKWHLLLGKES